MSYDKSSLKREQLEDKEVIEKETCFLCGSDENMKGAYLTVKYSEDYLHRICGTCAKKLSRSRRLVIADNEEQLFTLVWLTDKKPYNPKQRDNQPHKQGNYSKRKDYTTQKIRSHKAY